MGRDGKVHRQAADIVRRLKKAEETKRGGSSIKGLTLAKHVSSKKATHAVTCEVLRYWDVLEEVAREAMLVTDGKTKQKELVLVLVYELILGKGLHPVGKEEKRVLGRKAAIKAAFAKLLVRRKVDRPELLLSESTRRRTREWNRSARVNLLKLSVKDAIQLLEKENMQVSVDPYLPDVLQFPPDTDLHNHPLVVDKRLILQGWSSCIPAHALSPPPGAKVIDACAAPGNKTTHLASLMKGTGMIFAFDRDLRRAGILEENLHKSGAQNYHVVCADFLTVDPAAKEYADVSCILLDPSCSGSGTTHSRMEHLMPSSQQSKGKAERKADENRVASLANFQEKILLHALRFPGLERLVYSTCSVHVQENEQVVCNVLETATSLGFGLGTPIPDWPYRGEDLNQGGAPFIRVDPERDGCDGFFVALFERSKNIQSSSTGI